MEDIEKLKKIAAMSAELKKHGIAADSQDALKQAEEVYQEKTPGQFDAVPTQSTEESAPAPAEGVNSQELQRLQNSVNERLNHVEKDVSSIIEKMNEMIKVVNRLEARMESGGVPELPKEKQTTIAAPSQPAAPAKKEEGHARSGSYGPGDVQIDKIFYYGNR